MSDEFKLGDIVVVKSGGGEMTVAGLEDGGKVICEWLDKQDCPQRFVWSSSVLQKKGPGHLDRKLEYPGQGYGA